MSRRTFPLEAGNAFCNHGITTLLEAEQLQQFTARHIRHGFEQRTHFLSSQNAIAAEVRQASLSTALSASYQAAAIT